MIDRLGFRILEYNWSNFYLKLSTENNKDRNRDTQKLGLKSLSKYP